MMIDRENETSSSQECRVGPSESDRSEKRKLETSNRIRADKRKTEEGEKVVLNDCLVWEQQQKQQKMK